MLQRKLLLSYCFLLELHVDFFVDMNGVGFYNDDYLCVLGSPLIAPNVGVYSSLNSMFAYLHLCDQCLQYSFAAPEIISLSTEDTICVV